MMAGVGEGLGALETAAMQCAWCREASELLFIYKMASTGCATGQRCAGKIGEAARKREGPGGDESGGFNRARKSMGKCAFEARGVDGRERS